MSDDSEFELKTRHKSKKLKPKAHQLTDSSQDNDSIKTPTNTSKPKSKPITSNTATTTTTSNNNIKSGTLFDYFKTKREKSIIQQQEEDSIYPVSKKIEQEQQSPLQDQQQECESEERSEELEPIFSAKLPSNIPALESMLTTIKNKIKLEQTNFWKEQYDLATKPPKSIPENSIPICGNVSEFNFDTLIQSQLQHGGRLFDAIMMDPPWQLASAQPSRGVAIQYKQLSDEQIKAMPVERLQEQGFIFVWAINAKYSFACSLIENWGYKVVDEITWVKKTVNGKIAPSHGFYLQHAKESCIIGVKGNIDSICKKGIGCDVIVSKRRGQSQKPEEIYELIEQFVPQGFYLEIFGRRNNLRDRWVTLGNEL